MDLARYFLKLNEKYRFEDVGYEGDGESVFYGSRLIILYPLLKALQHLELVGIVHKDIKPDNIFIQAPGPVIKIGDFGGAYRMKSKEPRLVAENFKTKFAEYGTDFYVAPEVKELTKCTYCSDIWSLGMTLMLASHLPPQTELFSHQMIWRYDPYRHKLFSIRSLFKKALTLREISMDGATKALHRYLFDFPYPRREYTREAKLLMKEVHYLAGCMLKFPLKERYSASELLLPGINTPYWSAVCLGWENAGSPTSPRIFQLLREHFLKTLQM